MTTQTWLILFLIFAALGGLMALVEWFLRSRKRITQAYIATLFGAFCLLAAILCFFFFIAFGLLGYCHLVR